MRFINEILENENVVEHYLCKSKQLMKSRAGKPYLSLKLQDKTGTVDAKIWAISNEIKPFEENDFVKIDATAVTYQGEIQLNVKKLRKSQEGEYNAADYIPSTEKNIPSMLAELYSYIDDIEDVYIKSLLTEIFVNNTEIKEKLPKHSAAKNMHHGVFGGLVEHTLSVVQICSFMAPRYKYVNRDMLLACAMLHDIGKIFELSDFPVNDYTDDGQLIGHIIIGTELISEAAAKIDGFPPRLLSLIKHCILSHHGEYEYGSPQLPKTMEAFILHCADNADAKIKAVEEAIDAGPATSNWVGYHRLLQRNISKSDF